MPLVCQNCGSINQDPGGDPGGYLCGVCGQPCLQRVPVEQDQNNALAAAIAGGAIGGMAGGGPIGIVVGALIGAVIGSKVPKK